MEHPVLDAELAAALARDLARYGARAALTADNLLDLRADFLRRRLPRGAGGPRMRESRDLAADLPGRTIRLRLHVPDAAAATGPVLFYFHGGGWVWGSIDTHDRIMRELAQRAGLRVVGVDYRKAPEHPFPQPFDDCVGAARWVMARAGTFGIDPSRIAFGGDSAGGNLALAAGLDFAAAGLVPATLLLFYGAFATGLETASYLAPFGDGRFGLSRADMALFYRWYLPPAGTSDDWRAAPLLGDLAQLRHAYVLACGLDPLRDDSRKLAAALAGAGIDHVFREIRDAQHGFLFLAEDVALARHGLAQAGAELAAAFAR